MTISYAFCTFGEVFECQLFCPHVCLVLALKLFNWRCLVSFGCSFCFCFCWSFLRDSYRVHQCFSFLVHVHCCCLEVSSLLEVYQLESIDILRLPLQSSLSLASLFCLCTILHWNIHNLKFHLFMVWELHYSPVKSTRT
jgi:hypothetical protein